MDVCPSPRDPANDQVRTYPSDPDQVGLWLDLSASDARPLRDVLARSGFAVRGRNGLQSLLVCPKEPGPPARFELVDQADTSDSQLIARWRSRARSPMSMPVVVAICSIGVLMRSSTE